jgi:hypothetical protein
LVSVAKLDVGLLDSLFDNAIAGIRIAGFLDRPTASVATCCVQQHGLDYYADVSPPIGKIGITQFEYRRDDRTKAEYLALAAAANERRKRIFEDCGDPLGMVIDAISAGRPAELARERDGTPYFAGLVRVINEALLHCDWAPFDAPTWTIAGIDAQVTWNIYCQLPQTGGATTVYNRPWTPDAQHFQIPHSYGYRDDLVAGCEYLRIEPGVGDLIFFNSRNLHRVEAGSGADRISISSFVGRGPDVPLVLWS